MRTYPNVNCPTCGKQNTWHIENHYKPFCSDRCKLIDLGEWAAEGRKIAGASISSELTEAELDRVDDLTNDV